MRPSRVLRLNSLLDIFGNASVYVSKAMNRDGLEIP